MRLDGRSSELCIVGKPDHGGALVRGGRGRRRLPQALGFTGALEGGRGGGSGRGLAEGA